MTLDANDYRVNIPIIEELTRDMDNEQMLLFIGNLAIITGVPIIVVCSYIGEIYGRTPELEVRQRDLMYFYGVMEVLNEQQNIYRKEIQS